VVLGGQENKRARCSSHSLSYLAHLIDQVMYSWQLLQLLQPQLQPLLDSVRQALQHANVERYRLAEPERVHRMVRHYGARVGVHEHRVPTAMQGQPRQVLSVKRRRRRRRRGRRSCEREAQQARALVAAARTQTPVPSPGAPPTWPPGEDRQAG